MHPKWPSQSQARLITKSVHSRAGYPRGGYKGAGNCTDLDSFETVKHYVGA